MRLICKIFLWGTMLVGCQPQKDSPKVKVRMNWFSMQVNGQDWIPGVAPNDPCSGAFGSSYTDVTCNDGRGTIPVYFFRAFRDPNKDYDYTTTESFANFEFAGAKEPGIYSLEGSRKQEFTSNFMFGLKQPSTGKRKRYINDPSRKPFIVNVKAIYRDHSKVIPGIEGSFSGVLYNEENPSDSLIITKGEFMFKRVASTTGNCDYE